MNDNETHQKFISLRAQGIAFHQIAQELKVSKPTLISWSRKFQYEIQNLRAISSEFLVQKWLFSQEARINHLGEQLRKAEAELGKRNISELSTNQLIRTIERLHREIERLAGPMKFTTPVPEIPKDEYQEEVQDWTP